MVSDTELVSQENVQPTPDDSAAAWLMRGLVVGGLILGSANALSFFFRSSGWGSLLGSRQPHDEAIGFPLMLWEEGVGYASHPLLVGPFLFDVATGLVLGTVIGAVAVWQRPTLNQIMDRFRRQSVHQVRMQFSLRGLMITTVLAAIAAALVRSFTPRIEVLAAIYVFGPLALIVLAYLPRRLSWQQRVTILTPATIVMIAIAITLGSVLDVEFDKVLMGIFICWTPQAAFGAIALTAWILWREYRRLADAGSEG